MREVLRDIDARRRPEIVVINKADAADPMVLARLVRAEPRSVVVSARPARGIERAARAIERDLPRPQVEVRALVPYGSGDLVARVRTGTASCWPRSTPATARCCTRCVGTHARGRARRLRAYQPRSAAPGR